LTEYLVTHYVPSSGLDARATPDPAAPVVARLDPNLDVQVLDHRGAWAHVACSNGWEAWVDARRLVDASPAQDAVPLAPEPVPVEAPGSGGGLAVVGIGLLSLLGGAAVIIGSFLDWWSVGPASLSAWDIPMKFVLNGDVGNGIKAGPFLLVVVVLAVPMLSRKPLPSIVVMAIGAVPVIIAGMTLIRGVRENPSLDPRIGMILTLVGGGLVILDGLGVGARVTRRATDG
jgi:hypothetical protein